MVNTACLARIALGSLLLLASSLEAAPPDLSIKPAASPQFPFPGWVTDLERPGRIPQGRVEVVRRLGDVIYVGGDITTVAESSGTNQPRFGLAAVDASTGKLLPFAPKFGARVHAVVAGPEPGTLLVAGLFHDVNGQPRTLLAAIREANGENSPLLDGIEVVGERVKTLAFNGRDLFIGGNFKSVNGQPRHNLAKLVWSPEQKHFTLADWAPELETAKGGGKVMAMTFDVDGRLIVGGFFTGINGSHAASRLAVLDPKTGQVALTFQHLPDQPDGKPFPFAEVIDLARDGDSLYVGMGGPGGSALAYNLKDGKLKWFYSTDGNVQAVTVVQGWPVFGHHGDYVAKEPSHYIKEYAKSKADRVERKKIFLCDPVTGALQSWAPYLGRTEPRYSPLGVWTLDAYDGEVYAGGDFTAVGKVPQERFAIFRKP